MTEVHSTNFNNRQPSFIDGDDVFHKTVQQANAAPLQCFFVDGDVTPRVPGVTLTQLSELYLKVAEERSVHTALIWPGCPSSLPVIHSLACLRLWADVSIKGVRGLYYPAKRSSFYALNHIFVDPDALSSIANKVFYQAVNETTEINIGVALKEKMLLFFGVESLRKEWRRLARPSINEIFPHFSKEIKEDAFKDYSDRLYMKLRTKMHTRPKKALTANTFPFLGNPHTAPDAFFALGYRLTRSEVAIALKEIQQVGVPDVLLLDGTYNAVRSIQDWRNRFVALIHDVKKIFGDEGPGILVVTDEPRQASLLSTYLKQADRCLSREIEDNQHGIIHTGESLGFVNPDSETKHVVPEGKIRLFVTDHEVGSLIDEFNELAKICEERKVDATPIRNVIRFIAKLSHLPGSYENMWDYLNAQRIDPSTRYKFDWLTFQNGVNEFVSQNGAIAGLFALQNLMTKADRLVDAYRKGTPLALKVLHEIEKAGGGGGKYVTVVRHQLHRAVLYKYLEMNNTEAVHQVILARETEETLLHQHFDLIIFADMNAQILRTIMSNPMLPTESILILTLPMAKDLRYAIVPLLHMRDFEMFHRRLAQILAQLDLGLAQEGKSLIDDGFFQPSFSFSSYDDGSSLGIDERDKVYIGVKLHDDDRDEIIVRSKHSQMYVYEPDGTDGEHLGFREVDAGDLHPGQEVFLMSNDLRDEIETVLRRFGFQGSGRDAPYEDGLRQYHACISQQVKSTFGGSNSAQLRRLRQAMLTINPDIKLELDNIKYWVDLEKSQKTPFPELKPHAPVHYRVFKAFCQALDISEKNAQLFWFVIQLLRVIRRGDGRILSDVYSRILFDPESATIYTGIPSETIGKLRRKAMDHVHAVIEVVSGQ